MRIFFHLPEWNAEFDLFAGLALKTAATLAQTFSSPSSSLQSGVFTSLESLRKPCIQSLTLNSSLLDVTGSVASKQHYLNWGCVGSRALTDANLSMRRLDARYELDRSRKCVLLLLTAPPVLGRLP